MVSLQEREITTAEAVRRAAIYELLARCFAYPDVESWEAMQEAADFVAGFPGDTVASRLCDHLAELDREELEQAHIDTFTAVTSPDFPTYESAFVCTDPGQQPVIMADVAGFYRAFGLEITQDGFRPDDLSIELSFLGFLCRKEAYAAEHMGAPRVAQARRTRRLFLREHLGRWGGAIGGRLANGDIHPFYRDLGVALSDWVAAEAEATGAEPIDRVDRPLMPWPKAERGQGIDFGAPNGLISLEDITMADEIGAGR